MASLAGGGTGSADAAELVDLATEYAGPGRLRVVIAGGTGTHEALLHDGPFGAMHVVAGNGAIPGQDLARRGHVPLRGVGDLALVDGFDAALRRQWTRRVGPPPDDAYDGDALPVRGWWRVLLDGHRVELGFRMENAHRGYDEVYRVRYTRELGWVAAP